MPYKNDKSRAKWYVAKYHSNRAFKTKESKRKAAWYAAKASDPGWLEEMAARKREQRARAKRSSTTRRKKV